MTSTQKSIFKILLEGGSVARYRTGSFPFRLRTQQDYCVSKFSEQTFRAIKYFLRKEKSGLYVIDKRVVRRQRASTWIKKEYKKISAGVKTNNDQGFKYIDKGMTTDEIYTFLNPVESERTRLL